ncbi:MAG: phosphoenolpyruvate synthase [Nanoarchaeota archaeon]
MSISLVKDSLKNLDINDKSNSREDISKDNNIISDMKNGESYVRWFSELNKKDIPVAGGKGANLGEMFVSKFPVPQGYVVTAQAYEYYLKKSDLNDEINKTISELNVDDTSVLNEASKKIRSLIENGKIPSDLKEEILDNYKILSDENFGSVNYNINGSALSILKNSHEPIFVSVRSSATTEDLADASFAGQQDSFLNVKGENNLIEYIKKCFSSLYTPRAIFYRKKKGFSKASIAVVVQKMIDSEKSGVVFSRDPINQNEDIVVEAVYGLGEGIVSGKINPDSYVVDRNLEIKDIKIRDKKIAIVRTSGGSNEIVRLSESRRNSQVLTKGEIKEIADFAIRLEEHYGKPQDIEFAVESGHIYIVQSRPITTLGNKKEKKNLEGNIIVEGLAASPGIGVGVVRIIHSMEDLVNIKKGEVMVTKMTNPDMVVSMQKSTAIITDEGGITSHAAIVSREMGIPAVVGTGNASSKLKDGMKVSVDGFSGKVYEGEVSQNSFVEIKKSLETNRVKIKLIVDLPDYAERAAQSGIKEVGLTRIEGIIASLGKHPLWYEKNNKLDDYSKLIEEGIIKIVKHFDNVWIRSSDIRTDEYSSLEGAPQKEINPMLGFHGIRFSLKHPGILKAELLAVKKVAQANPQKKLGVMFPQIISIEEVKEARKYLEEFKTDNMEFGVMIETPSAVQIIDDIINYVDFVSFGTNDLTQYTLAVDRGEEGVQFLYNELHPAIFSQIGKVIDACKKRNVVTSICGQAGSKKEMIKFLVSKGIRSISINADAAYDVSKLVGDLEKENYFIRDENVIVKNNINNSINKNKDSNLVENNFDNKNFISKDLDSDERRKLKNMKKWEKFKKWKERKKIERLYGDKNKAVNNNENSWENKGRYHNWNKRAQTALSEDIGEGEVKISNNADKNNLLNEDNIKIIAEKDILYQPVENIDEISTIQEVSNQIEKDVSQNNIEKLEKKHQIEDNIEVEDDSESIKEIDFYEDNNSS